MKGEPPHVFTQHQTRGHEELGEVQSIDPFFLVLLELKARVLQKVYGVLGVHVLSGKGRGGMGDRERNFGRQSLHD